MQPDRFRSAAATRGGLRELLRGALEAQTGRVARNRWELAVPVALRRFEARPDFHFHQGFEMVIQDSGRSLWRLPDGQVPLGAGGMLLFPRGVAHREYLDEDAGTSCNLDLYFGQDMVTYHALSWASPEDRVVSGGNIARPASLPTMFEMLGLVVAEVERSGGADGPAVRGLVLAVLSLLGGHLASGPEASPPGSRLVSLCRQEALRYLCSTSLNVTWVAGRLGCSADYLSNIYRRETGQRLTAFINQERVRLGKALLAGSAMSVAEVAASCGYADAGYFARVFRRLTGHSPRAYRGSPGV